MGLKARRERTRRDPLHMLQRSHQRLFEHLSELRSTAAAVALGAADDPRAQLAAIVQFLQGPAQRHETDEEQSFFPRLRGRGIDDLLDQLSTEHREHEKLCRELAKQAGEPLDRAGGLELARLGEMLYRAYREHIETEEARLLPAARDLLGADERAAILGEMQARRGRA